MPAQSKTPKKRLKNQEGEDFFLYNSEEDTQEVIEVLGLDSKRGRSYDDSYSDENY